MSRYLRAVGKRLVVYISEAGHEGERVRRRNRELRVVRALVRRNPRRVLCFIVSGLGKTDAEGAHGSAPSATHERDHR